MNVGFIGLGAMGLPMARHLVEAGHEVTVASRSRAPIDAAVGFGATDGHAPHGVVEASDITILCVPNSPDVIAVLDDALPALGPGKIVVDTSTIDPDVERAQHARVTETGARYLEAPLSGGTAGAQKGTLTLMVGGDEETLEAARPVLDAFAGLIVHVGGPGMGQVVKLCNNLIYAAQMLATAEATVMAERAGVDLAQLYEVLTHATGDCVAVRTRLPAEGVVPDSPASNGWAPGFMTDLMAKDLDLAIGFAVAAHAAVHLRIGPPAPRCGESGGLRPRGLLRDRQDRPAARRLVSAARLVPSAPGVVLTLDLGTSATKAALWRGGELCALARASIATVHPQPGWAEQDPEEWWSSVVAACAEVRATAPSDYSMIRAIGFSAARETFALFDEELRPLTAGILWSDSRAEREATELGDPRAFRAETGVVLNAASHAAKVAWVARTAPAALDRALDPATARLRRRPHDRRRRHRRVARVAHRLVRARRWMARQCGGVLWRAPASSGLVDCDRRRSRDRTCARARAVCPASVVIGAGDRVRGGRNRRVEAHTDGVVGNHGERLRSVRRPGRRVADRRFGVMGRARRLRRRSGALGRGRRGGVVGVAHGANARRPLLRRDDRGTWRAAWSRCRGSPAPAVPGGVPTRTPRSSDSPTRTDPPSSRAVVEGIAFDVARCLELVAPERAEIAVAGAGAGQALWRSTLAAVTGLPVLRRAVDDAASVGARLIVAAALGESLDVDAVNPVVVHEQPDADLVEAYRPVRAASDAAAQSILASLDNND